MTCLPTGAFRRVTIRSKESGAAGGGGVVGAKTATAAWAPERARRAPTAKAPSWWRHRRCLQVPQSKKMPMTTRRSLTHSSLLYGPVARRGGGRRGLEQATEHMLLPFFKMLVYQGQLVAFVHVLAKKPRKCWIPLKRISGCDLKLIE